MRTVTIAAGWGWVTCAPTAIPVGARGASCTVRPALRTFLSMHGTPFHGKRVAPEGLVRVLACLAEGLGIRGTARGFEVDPNTVLQLAGRGRRPCAGFLPVFSCATWRSRRYSWTSCLPCSVPSRPGRSVRPRPSNTLNGPPTGSGWPSIRSKQVAVGDGRRCPDAGHGPGCVHQVVQVLAPECIPLCLTDGHKDYFTALLSHFGHWVHPARRHTQGPAPKPRWMPRPGRRYAQVVKTVRRRRLVRVRHRVVGGTLDSIEQVLAAHGWQINTAFVERINLTIRQRVAAVGRRVTTLCKHKRAYASNWPSITYYNFCWRHASLRQPLPSLHDQRPGCSPAVAALDAGDGGRGDGSGVDVARSMAFSGAAVAPATGAVAALARMVMVRVGGSGVPMDRANGLNQALGTRGERSGLSG